MCTLTLWWRVVSDAAVVVAANRDEDPRRPFALPSLWEEPAVLAGRDLVAGGTWLGVNREGVVCGLTNRWSGAPDPALASRGAIVVEALREGDAAAAARRVAAIAVGTTNPFVLLVADAASAWRIDHAATVDVRALTPGISVLANWGPDDEMPRSARAQALAREVSTASVAAALPGMRALVADHEGAAIRGQPICGHGERYATVCSTIIWLGATSGWQDTTGNPCTAPWVDRSDDLMRLRALRRGQP